MKKEIRLYIGTQLLLWAFTILPNGEFKKALAVFFIDNIKEDK